MPFVNVKMAEVPMTAEQKEKVIAGITEVLHRELGKKPESILVLLEEYPADSWGKNGTTLPKFWASQK
ncbi:MAG: 4-oxalocrotonate tautomerase family protein [Thermodesulfobacteriota bacterium]